MTKLLTPSETGDFPITGLMRDADSLSEFGVPDIGFIQD
jgi:hypothetical protein